MRAWHKKEKRWIEVHNLKVIGDTTFLVEGKNGNIYIYPCGERGVIDLEDKIGCRDINKMPIYDNDIVKWGHLENSKEDLVRIAMVKRDPDIQFVSHLPRIGSKQPFVSHLGNFVYSNTEKYLEVIGNIHDNNFRKLVKQHSRFLRKNEIWS